MPRSSPSIENDLVRLLAENQVLEDEARPRLQRRKQRSDKRFEDRQHAGHTRPVDPTCHRRIALADEVSWSQALACSSEFPGETSFSSPQLESDETYSL